MANKETKKLNLSVEEIENHRFGNAPRGYDALEVDKFLDVVIQDYLLLEERELVDAKELKAAENKIDELQAEIKKLMLDNERLQNKLKDLNVKGLNADNIDILKRISVLEKYLYKQGIDPKKIK